jgi:hypothetical protein
MPAAASIPNTFSKDKNRWYLIFEELPGISPLKYGENILERLAKPLSNIIERFYLKKKIFFF